MNALAESQDRNGTDAEKVFCLQQRGSTQFWDGNGWGEYADRARTFLDLDRALSVARRTGAKAVDLVVLFPSRARSLIIPLAG
jgi:hypothetical protein